MEYIDDTMNSIHFESPMDILAWDRSKMNRHNMRQFDEKVNRYLGDRSVPTAPKAQDVIRLAETGDVELHDKYIMPIVDTLNRNITSDVFKEYEHLIVKKRRVRTKSNFGNEIDIHKVYQGKIDKAWDSTTIIKNESVVNFITLYIAIGQNWVVAGMDSLWTCAVALKLSDELEMAGKNVQIIVGFSSERCVSEKKYSTGSCLIKGYRDRLASTRLAAMTHLGFLRSFMFCALLISKYSCYESLGRAIDQGTHNKHVLPINIRKEEGEGRTKAIVIGQSLNLKEALNSLKSAYAQLK